MKYVTVYRKIMIDHPILSIQKTKLIDMQWNEREDHINSASWQSSPQITVMELLNPTSRFNRLNSIPERQHRVFLETFQKPKRNLQAIYDRRFGLLACLSFSIQHYPIRHIVQAMETKSSKKGLIETLWDCPKKIQFVIGLRKNTDESLLCIKIPFYFKSFIWLISK